MHSVRRPGAALRCPGHHRPHHDAGPDQPRLRRRQVGHAGRWIGSHGHRVRLRRGPSRPGGRARHQLALLEASIDGAHGVLLSVQGGSDLGLFEINEAARLVQEAAHPEANIIFGAVIDDALGDEVRVTVIAAGDGGGPTTGRPSLGQVMGRQRASAQPQPAQNNHHVVPTSVPTTPASQPTQPPAHAEPVHVQVQPYSGSDLPAGQPCPPQQARRQYRARAAVADPTAAPPPRSRRRHPTCPTSSSDLKTRDPALPGPHSVCAEAVEPYVAEFPSARLGHWTESADGEGRLGRCSSGDRRSPASTEARASRCSPDAPRAPASRRTPDSTSAATSATRPRPSRESDALAASLGVTRDRLLFMNQVHGTDVVEVEGPWAGSVPRADGIVSATSRLALAVLVADCVPAASRRTPASSARCTQVGPACSTGSCPAPSKRCMPLARSRSRRSSVRPCAAGATRCPRIGSGGSGRRPHVRDDVLAGTPAIDVAAGVVEQLTGLEVPVERVSGCTREDEELYSYRRDGVTGRFAGVIMLHAGRDA